MLPPLTESLQVSLDGIEQAWPSSRLIDVVNDLADHRQMVLYFMLWEVSDRGTSWREHEELRQSLDPAAPWRKLETARENALIEAAILVPRENLFAIIEWIGQEDI